jgi:hypothetical protein
MLECVLERVKWNWHAAKIWNCQLNVKTPPVKAGSLGSAPAQWAIQDLNL